MYLLSNVLSFKQAILTKSLLCEWTGFRLSRTLESRPFSIVPPPHVCSTGFNHAGHSLSYPFYAPWERGHSEQCPRQQGSPWCSKYATLFSALRIPLSLLLPEIVSFPSSDLGRNCVPGSSAKNPTAFPPTKYNGNGCAVFFSLC